MKKVIFHFSCVAVALLPVTLVGNRVLAQLQLDCRTQTYSVCEGAPELQQSCTETCRWIPARPGSKFGIYGCRDKNGQATNPAPNKVVANEFSTVVASNDGYCDLAADQPDPVYCLTVYQCSKDCGSDTLGDLCGPSGDGTGSGSLVQPESVDWETPCPYYCE